MSRATTGDLDKPLFCDGFPESSVTSQILTRIVGVGGETNGIPRAKEKSMRRAILTAALALLAICVTTPAMAQDPMAQIQQLLDEGRQHANSQMQQAIQSYRQETGDYQNSDEAVWNYLVAESRRQNPEWYANLKQREAAFQQQQAAYVQRTNALMDMSFDGYMQRSHSQHQAHQNYIRNVIWERDLYRGSNGTIYELPYYSGGEVYQASDGSTFWQNSAGQYYQSNNWDWAYEMSPFGG